jgi:SAM-dependent methyltransferase
MLRKFLVRLKESTVFLNYGREVIADWTLRMDALRALDIGVGTGEDLLSIAGNRPKSLRPVELFGVDSYEPNLRSLCEKNIKGVQCNIETEALPFPEQTFDLILANQVLEHTKELFWIVSEVSRVIKPGGYFIVGVPNLASLHNRIALLFGIQPTSIDVLGPHVRGFTAGGLIDFLETDGYFKVEELKGSNFYPLPVPFGKLMALIFPTFAVSIFLKVRRTEKTGFFIDVLRSRFFETPYFTGPTPAR